jgi:hypothetical protein
LPRTARLGGYALGDARFAQQIAMRSVRGETRAAPPNQDRRDERRQLKLL